MTDTKKTAPDALRTDRLLAVQYAMLTKINALEIKERAMAEPPKRDESLHWERVHLASSARIAKDMAVQRGVDPELAAIACALHDIGRIVTGKQKDHAHQGEGPTRKLLEQLDLFSPEEIDIITRAVYNHTDKDVIGTELEEIVKDADVVDCYEVGMELPRPEQRARYQRYLSDSFGDLLINDAEDTTIESNESAPQAVAGNAKHDPTTKAITLLKILGADGVKIIDPAQVITEPWVRFKCQYDCSLYGKKRCCPPFTPDHKETREILDCYQTAILFHRKSEGSISEMAHKAMRQLFLDGCYKAAAFGSGACRLCESCDPDHCRYPEQATPSMEACGIDVMGTAQNCGFQINGTADGEEFINFFGLVLVK